MMVAVLPWLLIFPAALIVLGGRRLNIALWLLAGGCLLAFAVRQLTWPAFGAIGLLALAGVAVQERRSTAVKAIGVLVFILVALALSAHVAPGFHNPLVFDAQVSVDASPYRLYLNLDKLLILIWIVYAWRRVAWSRNVAQWMGNGVWLGLAAAGVSICGGWFFGLVAWDPKWPAVAWIWGLNNLLLVSLGEELFFRSFVQSGLARCWERRRYGRTGALLVAAILFGLAHYAAGPVYAAMAGLAGLGYGLAYQRGGLQAAVVAHALLNLVHFTLFTYPMASP